MSGQVIDRNEVILYDTHFPIIGNVRRTAVTPFAPKITQGDYTRDTKIVTSSWVISSMSGGLGIHDAQLPKDLDRFENSTLSTPYKYISLNPYVYVAGNVGGKVDLLIEYDTYLYACVGTTVRKWDEGSKTWTDEHTISGTANASAIYNGLLYIITDAGLHKYNGVTDDWVDFTSPDTYIPNGDYIIEWDGKLFRLGPDPVDASLTKMFWTLDPDPDDDDESDAVDWEEAGQLHLPRGYCKQLVIFFDLTGEPAIHAITRVGVYGYEFSQYKFFVTPITYPSTIGAGKGAMVWRGELYVPAGVDVYKYNGSTIEIVSPNKDDGLPSNMRGDVVQLVPGHAFYYAVISTMTEGSEVIIDMPFYMDDDPEDDETVLFEENPMVGAFPMGGADITGNVLLSPGSAWHNFYTTPSGGEMGYSLVASVQDTFRLWISANEQVYYINLNTGLHNPLQNPNTEFRDEGFLETPWVDMGWVELSKLALTLDVDIDGLNAVNGTYMAIDLAWDGSLAWEEVAVVTQNGITQYLIGGDGGKVFRRVKMRIRMYRGTTPITASPVLRSIIFGFMRRPKLLWGWDVDIQLTTSNFYGKSAEELIDRLYEITEDIQTAGRFTYRDHKTGQLRNRRVLVTNIQGSEPTGSDAIGRYTVSLIQLDEIQTNAGIT